MQITVFYIPYPSEETAVSAVDHALNQHLIACGNIISSQSMYIWEKTLNKDNEYIAIMKTTSACIEKLTSFIRLNHPYELPAIIHWEVNVNADYAAWVEKEVSIPSQ